MKATIHPTYYPNAKIVCSCGNAMNVGSSVEEIHVELCSKCHPFYTGKQNLVDTAGRVDRFAQLLKAKGDKTSLGGKKAKTEKRAAQKAAKKSASKPSSLNEA